MDHWDYHLNEEIAESRDHPELSFDETFNELELQRPIGSAPDVNHGSFAHFYGGINRSASAAVPVSSRSAPTQMEVAWPHSQGESSLGQTSHGHCNPFDYPLSVGSHTLSVGSQSPSLNFRAMNGMQSVNNSPALDPIASSDAFLHDLAQPAAPRNSYTEDIPMISVGPPQWNTQPFTTTSVSSEMGNPNHCHMTEQELSSFFLSQQMVGALEDSPVLQAQGYAQHSFETDFMSISDPSPHVSPELGPQDSLDQNFSTTIFINISPEASPELLPQDSANRTSSTSVPEIGWVRVEMNKTTKTMAPRSTSTGRKNKGRCGPLDPATRRKAAFMRRNGACESCRSRKSSCDDGIPCKACVRYHGVKLIQSPCRGRVLNHLTSGLFHGNVFPTARTLKSFLGDSFKLHPQELGIKLSFGFGPALPVKIKIVIPKDGLVKLHHTHVVYQWPPQKDEVTKTCKCTHQVFPAVLSDTNNLRQVLDNHLSDLVDNHFGLFPLYESELGVLKPIYSYYLKIRDCEARGLLRQALKLLTLVHIGGDTNLCDKDANAKWIIRKFFGISKAGPPLQQFKTCPSNFGAFPIPCFIRGQFGSIMPLLAKDLMRDILTRLETMSLGRECHMWANACATFAVLIMASESIDYHARKVAFHASNDGSEPPSASAAIFGPASHPQRVDSGCSISASDAIAPMAASEEALNLLLKFYKACFGGCHVRLHNEPQARSRSNSAAKAAEAIGQKDAQNVLIAELKNALAGASSYLMEKANDDDEYKRAGDLSYHFDRKLAKLFALSV